MSMFRDVTLFLETLSYHFPAKENCGHGLVLVGDQLKVLLSLPSGMRQFNISPEDLDRHYEDILDEMISTAKENL
jgi:hypothetical protein